MIVIVHRDSNARTKSERGRQTSENGKEGNVEVRQDSSKPQRMMGMVCECVFEGRGQFGGGQYWNGEASRS